jgi:hypothetical protein
MSFALVFLFFEKVGFFSADEGIIRMKGIQAFLESGAAAKTA